MLCGDKSHGFLTSPQKPSILEFHSRYLMNKHLRTTAQPVSCCQTGSTPCLSEGQKRGLVGNLVLYYLFRLHRIQGGYKLRRF